MSLLHKIIKKELAKRYVEPDTKIGPLEKACTCDPEDGPFYLPINNVPGIIKLALKMRNKVNSVHSCVKGIVCYDDSIGLHVTNSDEDAFSICPFSPVFKKSSYDLSRPGRLIYEGRRSINGNDSLCFTQISDENKCNKEYFSREGRLAFDFWNSDYMLYVPYDKIGLTDLFGETVLAVNCRDVLFHPNSTLFLSYDTQVIFRHVTNVQAFEYEGKGYIYGLMPLESKLKVDKISEQYNLCDRDGNLYARHGGPFYKIDELTLKTLGQEGLDLVYCRKNEGSFHFFDRDGKVIDAFGCESKSRTLHDVRKIGDSWYGIGHNQEDNFDSRVFSYDGTDMLIQSKDLEQLSGLLGTYLGDDRFDEAFEEYYFTVHEYNDQDRKKILGMLIECDTYAKENIDEPYRTYYLIHFMRLINASVFYVYDNSRINLDVSSDDESELEKRQKECNLKHALNVAKACRYWALYSTHPYTAVGLYVDHFQKIIHSFGFTKIDYMDYFWFHIQYSPEITLTPKEYYDVFSIIESRDLERKTKDQIKNMIKTYSEQYLSDPEVDASFASNYIKGLFSYLKDELRYHPKRLEKYTSTISSERFDEIGFTHYIMLDSFGLLKKYEKISTNMKLIGLKKSDLRQAYDGISETMDMVLERSKRRHTNPRDDISDFLENVNMSILHAPDSSVEYIQVIA